MEQIKDIVAAQKQFFKSGATLDINFRKRMLCKLLEAIEAYEERLAQALWSDMHKSYEEAYLTELSIVKAEIKTHLKSLSKWMKREKVATPITLFPSRSYIVKEPLGMESPLMNIVKKDKIVMTPHIAWASVEARARLVAGVTENLKAYLAGEKRNVVNPPQ